MHKKIRNLALVSFAAAAVFLAGTAPAQAHGPNGTLSEPQYREMQRLAQRLDAQARHAADQSAHDQYRLYRRDNSFVRSVSNFARRASRFDARMTTYQAQPWQVDDELRLLLRSARGVQNRVQHSRWVDNHTVSDWNEVVGVLNRMIRVSQADDGRFDFDGNAGPGGGSSPPSRVYERDQYGNPVRPADNRPDEYRRDEHDGGVHNPSGHGFSREELSGLAHELEDRATRAHELAERLSAGNRPRQQEFLESIHHFNEQSAVFHQRVESGMRDPAQIRAEVNHLLDDARQADQGMRQANVFPEVWQEWQGAMRVLQRILDLVGA